MIVRNHQVRLHNTGETVGLDCRILGGLTVQLAVVPHDIVRDPSSEIAMHLALRARLLALLRPLR